MKMLKKMEENSTWGFAFFLLSLFLVLPWRCRGLQKGLPHYARFTFDAARFPSQAEYDYVVVGGGTAGCPLAATLSQSGHHVLLLERGGAPFEFSATTTMDGFLHILSDPSAAVSDDHPSQPFVSDDGVPNTRARVLGGGSAINAGFYSRAHAEFFNSTSGVVDWDMRLVNESYEWVESAVAFRPKLRSWQAAVRDGLLQANVTPYNGFTVHHLPGTKIGATTFDSSGRRHTAADLLNFAKPECIRVALRATVERVLFQLLPARGSRRRSKPAAAGVIYRDRYGGLHNATLRRGGEVVLSAGALGSPQLLLLSGVGSRHYLSSLGIPVVQNLPGVGSRMADNPRNGVSLIPSSPVASGDHSLLQVVGISGPGGAGPFIEAASNAIPFLPFSPQLTICTLIEKVPGPYSFGSLRLSSLDVRHNPAIRFNYFSHPSDLAACVSGMRKVGEVLHGASMDGYRLPEWMETGGPSHDFRFVGEPLPEDPTDDATMEKFCRRTVSTIWHYHGGCAVGEVVDGGHRLRKVAALRVVDGSTFLESPGTNPQATVMMLGRYMGTKITRERSRRATSQQRISLAVEPPPTAPSFMSHKISDDR